MGRKIVWSLFSLFLLSGLQGVALAKKPPSHTPQALIAHVKASIEKAERGISRLDRATLTLEGLSCPRVRHLLNNLCSLPRTCYMEIGTGKGSTLIPALYNNETSVVDAIAFDNFSDRHGPTWKPIFYDSIQKYLRSSALRFFEMDCYKVNKDEAFRTAVNVFFYDGENGVEENERAFTYFNDIFDEYFIAVIDDWNWERSRKGTEEAIAKLGYKIHYMRTFYNRTDGGDPAGWWNGLFVGVISKH